MFVLGLLFWMFDKSMEFTIQSLKEKFDKKPDILEANLKVLNAGWNYGDTTEVFTTRSQSRSGPFACQKYFGQSGAGNRRCCRCHKAGIPLFLGLILLPPLPIFCTSFLSLKRMAFALFRPKMRLLLFAQH